MDELAATLSNQIPIFIMALGQGRDIKDLALLVCLPLLIYLLKNCNSLLFKLFDKKKIKPDNFVSYTIGDTSSNNNCAYSSDFVHDLSGFLNKYNRDSIKYGEVAGFFKMDSNPNMLFRYLNATIKPHESYDEIFCFSKKHNGKNVIQLIKDTGFVFPKKIKCNKLLEHPIYISLQVKEQAKSPSSSSNSNNDKIIKTIVSISAIDIQTAKNFIFVVVNYARHISNNINNFKLTKSIYFADYSSSGQNLIVSTVNVIKKYNNVFLTSKNSELINNIIIEWNNNKEVRISQGIPNKLGIMFVGSPGCGKSSLIYAIANETKKQIVSINLDDFTNEKFMRIMAQLENKVIVFDDIDAYKFTHKRDLQKANDLETIVNLENVLDQDNKKNKKNKTFSSLFLKQMTLNIFLEVLDGYNYLNNCIVIITSNYPELIDDAIIRPGRIDCTINFELADEHQFSSIFKYFVGIHYKTIDPDFIFKAHIHSTSYLINSIIVPHKNNPTLILQLLSASVSVTNN